MTNEFNLSQRVLKSLKENGLLVDYDAQSDSFTVVFDGFKPVALIQNVSREELPVFLNGYEAGMRVSAICTN